MTASPVSRPQADEYAPYYAGYISKVPEGDSIRLLETQIGETMALLGSLSDERALFRYAPDKWSVKEIVGHLSDTERIMAYRALRFARADLKPLTGFEQDEYVEAAHFDRRPFSDILDEFRSVRQATVTLFRSFTPAEFDRRGAANNTPVTVRALLYIVAGHERHHVDILKSHYRVGG